MKFKAIVFLALMLVLLPASVRAESLADRLKGRILLQVEARGEAWYVNPASLKRYYLGRSEDAFRLMRELGLGISEHDFKRFKDRSPAGLLGRIVLRVHDRGQAYYVNPLDRKFHYLGRPQDAFNLMRELGLGISNSDLRLIPAEENHSQPDYFRTEVSASGSGADPSVIRVPRGSRLDLRIAVSDYGLRQAGIYFRASNGVSGLNTINQGSFRDISLIVNDTFSYTPFLSGTNIRLPYEISIQTY